MRSRPGGALRLAFASAVMASAGAASAAEPILSGKQVTLIVDATGADREVDEKIAAHMRNLGAQVILVDDAQMRASTAEQDLIAVSSTADVRAMRDLLRDARVPVLTWNNATLPGLGLTGTIEGEDFGLTDPDTYLAMTNAPHPMAAGVAAGNFVANTANSPRGWGLPGAGAQVIATQPGFPDRAVIFGFEKDALLADGRPAPARRVSFFFHDKTFDGIEAIADGRQAKGLALFDAALRWTVGQPSGPGAAHRHAGGKKLAYVTLPRSPHRDPGVRAAVDRTNAYLLERFGELGFRTTVVNEDEGLRDIADYDVMVIGATVRANRVLGAYKDTPIPVLLLENDILDDMNLTPHKRHEDFGEIEAGAPVTLVNPAHPVAAGVAAGPLPLYRAKTLMGFGLPGPGATVIAAADEQRKAVIFAYEKGATMGGNVLAPARRVYFPIDFQGVENLTDAGLQMFDAALFWAAGDR